MNRLKPLKTALTLAIGVSSLMMATNGLAGAAISASLTEKGLPTIYKRIYLTAEGGVGVQANAHMKGVLQFENRSGAAGRFSAGYTFAKVLGLESGYTRFYRASPRTTNGLTQMISKVYTVDFLATINFNYNRFYLIGKVGPAYVKTRLQNKFIPLNNTTMTVFSNGDVRPEIGFNLGVLMFKHVMGRLGYFHIVGRTNIANPTHFVPALDFYSAGLSYVF